MRLIDMVQSPWAITPEVLQEICGIYVSHTRREKLDVAALEARLGRPLGRKEAGYEVRDGVAVLAIDGPISKRMNLLSQVSGGASTDLVMRDLKDAADDPAVKSILLQISSPGGTVDGTQELARMVRRVDAIKPVVAIADGLMASAAYWIGSAAREVYAVSDTTQVGSIGVVATHVDVSAAEAAQGFKTTEITAGRYKRIASAYEPLSDEGRASIQDQVDYLYSVFVNDVAEHRGVSTEQVVTDMADGRVFVGQQAVRRGLVDGIVSIEDLIADMASGQTPRLAGEPGARAGVAQPPNVSKDSDMDITLDMLERDHADIVEALRAQGASAERERVLGIEAAALPGHESLVAALKADGKTSPAEAALAIVQAEQSRLAAHASALRDDAPAPVPSAPVPDAESVAAADAALPLEDRARKQYEADPQVRSEFPTLGGFVGFLRATESGRARIFRK